MASDRPDPSDDARPRFTTRTYLLPDDEPDAGAPTDAAFGTGDIDDDALDAIVQDVDAGDAAAFVWPADVGEALPLADADPEPVQTDADEAVAAMWDPEPDAAGQPAPIAAPLEAFDEPLTMDASEFMPTSDPFASQSVEAADLPAPPPEGASPVAADSDDPPEEATGFGDAVASAGASVLGALADVVEPDADAGGAETILPDEPADPFAAADLDEPDVEPEPDTGPVEMPTVSLGDLYDPEFTLSDEPAASADAAPDAAGVFDSPDSPVTDDVTSDLLDAPADVDANDAATDAVDDAFDAATDADKAETPETIEIEGDLDVQLLGPADFSKDELRDVLRTMMTSRKLDEKMLTLLKQGKGYFHIGSSGHEASQAAVGREFEGGKDWFCFYYRDLATALSVGVTPAEIFRAHYGKATDPFGGGRQMPEHFGHRALNIMSTSSSVAAQYVPAVGFALAVAREDDPEAGPTRAVYASGGEGSTSQGAFHEALNWAARETLPVLFHIQDNKFAISVPVAEQTAGGSIWHLLGGYSGLKRVRYDGTDFFQSASVAKAAMAHIRAGNGPVALHADLVRLLPHSSSDDHRKYREDSAIAADLARDPIPTFIRQLTEAGVMTDDEVDALRTEVAGEIDRLAKEIEKEADPDPATATDYVYYDGPDSREYETDGEAGDLVVMVDAINHALDEELDRDERVLVYGEDVGGGKGGVFTATRGLAAKHGKHRCFNSPLAEHSIVGSAVGLACAGYKPVVEIQFADYIWPAMQQIRNQVASMRYRSNNEWACPMVLRVPAGGYIHGGLCHSQNIEAIFGHFPGLHVVMPSNAADAKGLLKAAIRGEDPVLFLEHKALYRQGPARRPEPHADYLVPLGKAAVTREGTDLTIVTWGAIVYKALNVAKTLEKEGVSVEVIDVRSFLPFDTETVLASARKTGRVLVAYEDHEFMGFGAEIAAQISDAAFGALDAPVKRVAGAFSSIPYADVLESEVLPQDDDVLEAAREVLGY